MEKWQKIILPVLFMASAASTLTAKDSDASAVQAAFSGKMEGAYFMPILSNANYEGFNRPYVDNEITLKVTGDRLSLVSSWNLNVILSNTNYQIVPAYDENYLSVDFDKFRFRIGLQDFSWGSADTYNPMDNINPRDYTAVSEPAGRKIPVFSVSGSYYPADWLSLEAVGIPYKQPAVFNVSFPDEIPAALFSKTIITGPSATSNIAYPKNITVMDPQMNPTNVTAGFKINFFTPDIDVSGSYLYDVDQFYTPKITTERYFGIDPAFNAYLQFIGQTNNTYLYRVSRIELVKKHIHRFGADFKARADRYTFWGESAYNLTEDPLGTNSAVRNPSINWTLGGDVNFGADDKFYINLQYVGRYIFNYDKTFYTDYKDGLPNTADLLDADKMQTYYNRMLVQKMGLDTEELLQGAAIRFEWKIFDGSLSDLLKLKLTALGFIPQGYDTVEKTRNPSYLLSPEFDYKPLDGMHFRLGAVYSAADEKLKGSGSYVQNPDDILGSFHDESSVYLKVSYEWAK